MTCGAYLTCVLCGVCQGFKTAMLSLSNCSLLLVNRPRFGEEADLSSDDEEGFDESAVYKHDNGSEAESVDSDSVDSDTRRREFRRTHVIIPGVGPVKMPIGVAFEVSFDTEQYFSKANRALRERLAR